MIEIKNLSYAYTKNRKIFSGVDLTFNKGCIYGLLGENGVGKTTLLKLIAGLIFPKEGEVLVHGVEAKKRRPDILGSVFCLSEDFYVPSMSIEAYAKMYKYFYSNFDESYFVDLLAEFSVDSKRKLTQLSHGQQKKAMLSFALACKTSILLLDEPTNGMDIPSKGIFRKIIAQASNEDNCIIISTHQVKDVENLIDPIIILDSDQVILNNSMAEISRKLKFEIKASPSEFSLYMEPALGGCLSVEPNTDGIETKVNIEMLFNAAMRNKNLFIHWFVKETSN